MHRESTIRTTKKDIQNAAPDTTPTPVAVYNGPSGLADNITSQDLRLPRVALLQPLSPQVQNDPEKYKPGMFIDTLTQDIINTPVEFVPVFVFKNVIKWKPRAEGGGMVWKTLNPTAEQLRELQWDGANKPTADQYINAVCTIPQFETPLIISFCKTSLKAGQDLATLIQLSKCAWRFTYTLESVKTTNTKGTFYVMRVKRGKTTDDATGAHAADLYDQVKSMSIETDYEGTTHEQDPSTSTGAEPSEF